MGRIPVSNKITFYAIIEDDASVDQPHGLVRRLEFDKGFDDEVLGRDMSWHHTPVIVEWEHDGRDDSLVEVSHEQASRIVQYFREKFAE
jgi:hypothetical protein